MPSSENLPASNSTTLLESPVSQKQLILSIVSTAIFLTAFSYASRFIPQDYLSENSLEEIRRKLLSFGLLTPVAFCLLYALRAVIYLPEPLLMSLAGFIVGPIWAVPLILAGASLASLGVFGVARVLKYFGDKTAWFTRFSARLQKKMGGQVKEQQAGYYTLLVFRLMPVYPFVIVTYGAVLVMDLDLRRFMKAMTLGSLPAAIFYSSLASAVWINLHSGLALSNSWHWTYATASLIIVFWALLFTRLLRLAFRKSTR